MLPLLEVRRPSGVGGTGAESWNNVVLQFILAQKVPNVILVGRWAANIDGRLDGNLETLIVDRQSKRISVDESKQALRRGFQRTLTALKNAGVKIWVMKQVPLQDGAPHKRLARWALFDGKNLPKGVSVEAHKQRQQNVTEILSDPILKFDMVLDPADFCFDGNGRSKITNGTQSYYWDNDHLSAYGGEDLLQPLFEPVFRRITDQ